MNTVMSIRTEKKVRDEAKKVFDKIGISTSAGINMFLRQVAVDQGIPFKATVDTKKLKAKWDKEVAWALKHGKSYATAKEMHEAITRGE